MGRSNRLRALVLALSTTAAGARVCAQDLVVPPPPSSIQVAVAEAPAAKENEGSVVPASAAIPAAAAPVVKPLVSEAASGEKPVAESIVEASPVLCEPCQCDFRLKDDIRAFPAEIWDDFRSIFVLHTAVVLGEGAALAAVSYNNWDEKVRNHTAEHPDRWGVGFNDAFDVIGHPLTQLGAAGAVYTVSLLNDDPKLHDFSKALLNSLIMTDLGVIGLKYSFHTERPNGEENGFPSGHVASSFAAAAVVDSYYGGFAGLSAYTLAGLVAWQRIDDRKHDLSDVLFGAAFGYAIGKAVSFNHLKEKTGWEIFPVIDIHTGTSLMFRRAF
jgi:hypothetical protein